MQQKKVYFVTGRRASGNATREVRQHHTWSLQLPHVKLTNATRGNWRKFMLDLTVACVWPTLSLLCGSKYPFVTNWLSQKIRFKRISRVQGRKVPPRQKQGARTRQVRKNVYKNRRPWWGFYDDGRKQNRYTGCRITNAYIKCGRISNPPEQKRQQFFIFLSYFFTPPLASLFPSL